MNTTRSTSPKLQPVGATPNAKSHVRLRRRAREREKDSEAFNTGSDRANGGETSSNDACTRAQKIIGRCDTRTAAQKLSHSYVSPAGVDREFPDVDRHTPALRATPLERGFLRANRSSFRSLYQDGCPAEGVLISSSRSNSRNLRPFVSLFTDHDLDLPA